MAAGSIVIDLLMKTGSFETDTKRAEKRLKEFEKTAQQWGTAVAGAATVAATAFAYLAKQSINNLDALDEMSQSLGIAVEQLSSLANVARIEGMALEDFGASMAKLSKVIGEARAGSEEAGAVFKAMGLDPKQFKDSEDALLQISTKFAGYRDGLEKSTLSMELFGKSGYKMIAFLNQGADGINATRNELDSFGLTTSEAAKQAGELNDTLTKIGIIFDKIVEKIVSGMLPTLKALTDGFFDAAKAAQSLSIGGLAALEMAMGGKSSDAIAEQQRLIEEIQKTEDALKSSSSSVNQFILEQGLAYKRARLSLVNQQINLQFAGDAGDPFMEAAPKLSAPKVISGAAKESEYEKAIKNLKEQIALTGALTEYEKVFANIQLGRYGKLLPDQEKELGALAEQLDLTKKIVKENEAYTKFIDDITGRTEFDDFLEKMGFLSKAMAEGAINADQYSKGVDSLAMKFKGTTEQMSEFAIQAARNIQDTLGNAMEQVLAGNFNNIGNLFTQMLNRMIAQLAASQLSQVLFGSFGTTGVIGGLAGAAGSAIANAFTPGAGTMAAGSGSGINSQGWAEGGYTGEGGKYEAAGVVHKGEYVFDAASTRRIGVGALNRMRGYADGGYVGANAALPDMGAPSVTINLVNQSKQPLQAEQGQPRFDGQKFVQDIILSDLRRNGPIGQAIRG
jgi:hypothetical protein